VTELRKQSVIASNERCLRHKISTAENALSTSTNIVEMVIKQSNVWLAQNDCDSVTLAVRGLSR